MKYKLVILAVIISASMLTACKGGKTEAGAENATAEDEPAAVVAEPAYDLKALAEALEGCTYLKNFKNGVAALKKDGEWLYVDKMGRFVDPVQEPEETESAELKALLQQHEYHGDFSEGLCWISEEDGMIGFIDERGEVVIPCQYEWAIDHVPADFHEGVCPVMTIPERELFSFIDKTGQLAFPGYFHTGNGFTEGLAAVKQVFMDGDDVTGSQSGYIDHTGKMVIRLAENDSGSDFHEGMAKVSNWYDNTAWFIDKAGNKVFDLDLNRFYRDNS
ncbi:MAG: WG repeat-containing protein, partial [Bacteroidales bacterium]|nr:WG repeat-containing protein [Bacteroidales bacterium]